MENKYVGYLLFGISIVIVLLVMLFNSTLKEIIGSSCGLAHGGDSCPMYDTVTKQTYLALGIIGVLIIVALILIFSKPQEKIIVKTKTIEKKPQKKIMNTDELKPEEKKVLIFIQANKTIFQA